MLKLPGQRPNENILMVIRKHVIVYVRIVLAFIVTVLAPLVVFLSIWLNYFPDTSSEVKLIIGLGSCIYILYGLLLTVIAWINEEFDIFVLTNERLIDIDQVSFLRRNVASTPLNQIQDTTSDVNGLFPTMLDYGDVQVQTAAGAASDFHICRVPDPAHVARTILNYARESRVIHVDNKGSGEGLDIEIEPKI